MSDKVEASRVMPKGGKKGGSRFPRIDLSSAVAYAKKLVSKAHVGPQSVGVIYSGVVGAKSGTGDVRIGALRQYGFLAGNKKNGFTATGLAKDVAASPGNEVTVHYQLAALSPTIFRGLFDTFHGDTVSRAKLRQRCADLRVHPDEVENCVDLYVSSILLAELATINGDDIVHKHTRDIQVRGVDAQENTDEVTPATIAASDDPSPDSGHHELPDVRRSGDTSKDSAPPSAQDDGEGAEQNPRPPAVAPSSGPHSVFNVNVTLDSSLDIEKLERQLETLKRFGAI